MNKLTEMMIEQKTRWALPSNKAEIVECLMKSVESGGVVRIEDDLMPDGRVTKYGSRVIERRFFFVDGGYRFIDTFRGGRPRAAPQEPAHPGGRGGRLTREA